MVRVRATDLKNALATLKIHDKDVPQSEPAWWMAEGQGGFGWALARMNDGYYLRRNGWPASRDLREVFRHDLGYLDVNPDLPTVLVQRDGAELEAVAIDDILAWDWELAD